jgi:signal transduction histidine kinase
MKAAATSSAMDSVINPVRTTAACEYQQLMSDMLHDLSQPLSTITCLLEVNLLLSHSAKQSRHNGQIALQQVRSVVWLFRALRELWEAGNADQDRQVVPLVVCLREVVADLLPVAESAKVKLSLTSNSDCRVNFQASRLRQALFHLLEFALGSSTPGAEVKITAREADEARVTVAISAVEVSGSEAKAGGSAAESTEWKQRDLKRRLGLAVAWRIFESAGGNLRIEEAGGRSRLEVFLPLAPCLK